MADSIAAFGTLDTTWMMIYATCKSQAQLLPTPQDHSYGSIGAASAPIHANRGSDENLEVNGLHVSLAR